MKIFTVHSQDNTANDDIVSGRRVVFVKEGFSWPAFLVPPLWLIAKRMWLVLAVFVLAETVILLLTLELIIPQAAVAGLSFAVFILFGYEANNLYRWTLRRRHFREDAVVAAANLESAEHRYFSNPQL